MGNLDHCFGSRSPSELSLTRPSRNNILFLVISEVLKCCLPPISEAVCFLTGERGEGVFF